jgi:hypothetical protein
VPELLSLLYDSALWHPEIDNLGKTKLERRLEPTAREEPAGGLFVFRPIFWISLA